MQETDLQQRCDWVRAVPAVLAALVLASPAPAEVQTGYDKGFFIKSDAFEVHIGSRVQLQFSSLQPDTSMFDSLLGRTEETEADNELNVRRFKLYLYGSVHDPSLKFKLQLDVERFRAGGGSAGNVRLEEAFLDLTRKPWTQLRLGLFKVPFGYEKMTSSGRLNLVDRSIVHTFFGIDQESGIDLFGQSFDKKWRYDVAITTGVSDNKGFDTRNDLASNGESDFRYMARVTWEPLDVYSQEQGATGAPEKAQLTVQLGAMVNSATVPLDADPFLPANRLAPFSRTVLGAPSDTFDVPTNTLLDAAGLAQGRKTYDRRELELVTGWRWHDWAVEGQAIWGDIDPDLTYILANDPDVTDLTFDNRGLRVQAGWFVKPTRLEIAARWAQVERESTASFAVEPDIHEEIEHAEWRAGINWYFRKHDWKWQTDIGQISTEWTLDGTRLAVPDPAANPNLVIQNNKRTDDEIRTQFQVQF